MFKPAGFLVMVACLALVLGCDSGDRTAGDPVSIQEAGAGDPIEHAVEHTVEAPVADSHPPRDRQGVIAKADAMQAAGRVSAAYDELSELLIRDPGDAEVLFRMATLATAMGDPANGIDLLSAIPADHPEAGLAALGQSADWCMTIHRYQEAESRYRKILEHAPGAVPALRPLAFLLNRQGRRQEASELVRQLCLQGDVTKDELHSLIAIGDAMYDAPPDDSVAEVDTADPRRGRQYFPIAPYGQARRAFRERRFTDVIELLKPAIDDSSAPPAMVALFGRAAAETQDDAMLAWWFGMLSPPVGEFADYWATLGTLELMSQNYDSAIRALGEAVRRDPTDLESVSRMRQALGSLGREEDAQRWFQRWTKLRAAMVANNLVAKDVTPDPAAVEQLAIALEELDRPLEAILWRATMVIGDQGGQRIAALNEQRKVILARGDSFPTLSSRLCGLDIQQHPLPDRNQLASITAVQAQDRPAPADDEVFAAAFANVANRIDLQHTYRVATVPQSNHFSIYQTLGGGVAVLDFDLDGLPDLYFAQGAADPPLFRNSQPNQLYRNLAKRVTDATEFANVAGSKYTLGVTAGDWNQDGFSDLAVANIGACVLFLNHGDGTFTERRIQQPSRPNRIPASIAIADVTGDDLPDVLELGYIDDPDMALKSPLDASGTALITIGPDSFDAAIDHLFVSQGDGTFHFRGLTDKADARPGLGLVVADIDGVGCGKAGSCNEVFIGNDTKPNRLWKLEQQGQQADLATLLGCAYGFSGGATGAMGIAVGDFDNNSKIDLHVTNYENENSSLFMMNDRSFQDRNRQFRLGKASKLLVGFGTQAIDYDNDGDEDILVANGHLDQAKSIRGTYAQPMQLFCNVGNRFRLGDVKTPSGFWSEMHVGRGLATLDFNRDGQTDVVVTQIERASALLVNQSNLGHHWIQVVLAGTASERDATGARIEIQFGDRQSVCWIVGGDGYLCSNEQVCSFGLGDSSQIDQLHVRWPSGRVQTFDNPPADRRVLVVESDSALFVLK